MLWKLADRCKCAQPIGETFPIPTLSLCNWGGKLEFGVDYEIRWGYSLIPRVSLWIRPQVHMPRKIWHNDWTIHVGSGLFFIDNEQANKKMLVPFFLQRLLYSLVIFKKLKDESHKNRKRNKGPCFHIPHIYVLVSVCHRRCLRCVLSILVRQLLFFMSFDKRTQQFTPFFNFKDHTF